ncbi:MAG: universal stress protein UspA [Sphingobium sp.]|nr:universal stress protein UspA [Sphingobium sp.]
MKNILLPVHDDEGQEARLQCALDLARTLEGHLNCIGVTMIPMVTADISSGAAQAMLLENEREQESLNRAALEARLGNEDVSWDWTDVVSGMAPALLDASLLSDIIVLNRQLDTPSYIDMHDVTSSVVMKARSPVLAVPETQKGFAAGRAFIAWDGGEACCYTMRACVPLLKQAEEVCLFTAAEKANGLSPETAARYLSRHAIHATVQVVERGTETPDALILREAEAWKADYVLMGAYGRGRLRETFGGVTKRLLASSPLPLILGR